MTKLKLVPAPSKSGVPLELLHYADSTVVIVERRPPYRVLRLLPSSSSPKPVKSDQASGA